MIPACSAASSGFARAQTRTFRRGERKDDIAKEYLERFSADEGVLFIGKAQEKTTVIRTERRRNPRTGASYAWLVRSSAMVSLGFLREERNDGNVLKTPAAPAQVRRGLGSRE
jgi:hypothetical protein